MSFTAFKKFARVFFAPIIELAIADDSLKPGFHYFLRDICVFFLKGYVSRDIVVLGVFSCI